MIRFFSFGLLQQVEEVDFATHTREVEFPKWIRPDPFISPFAPFIHEGRIRIPVHPVQRV